MFRRYRLEFPGRSCDLGWNARIPLGLGHGAGVNQFLQAGQMGAPAL